jgi:hypothetical protein
MAQHFLLSAAARSLSLAKVMRMLHLGVENVFLRLRWPKTDGSLSVRTVAARPVTPVVEWGPAALALQGVPPRLLGKRKLTPTFRLGFDLARLRVVVGEAVWDGWDRELV